MDILSQTIYHVTSVKEKVENVMCADGIVEVNATVYVPKLLYGDNEHPSSIWRSHYFYRNIRGDSYALLQFDGDVKELNGTIRETCYGNFVEIGGSNGAGAFRSCIEKLVDKEWVVISGYKDSDESST